MKLSPKKYKKEEFDPFFSKYAKKIIKLCKWGFRYKLTFMTLGTLQILLFEIKQKKMF